MSNPGTATFRGTVEMMLGEAPPRELDGLVRYDALTEEARAFIERMLALMRHSGHGAAEINPYIGWQLGHLIPSVLPGAWGGRIPPITMRGRHGRLDYYASSIDWPDRGTPNLFIDLGCGFPPVTTAETACHLQGWKVVGTDQLFAPYIVYDDAGNYACFDQEAGFLYFQPAPGGRHWQEIYQDPEGTKARFVELFQKLHPLLERNGSKRAETVQSAEGTLVRNCILTYETDNLSFLESRLEDLELPPAQFVRCMNMLLYFAAPLRDDLTRKGGRLLEDGGLMIAGTNGPAGTAARYAVYERTNSTLVPREFAFSVDNIYPMSIMAWFTLHPEDPEAWMLADLVRILRCTEDFWLPLKERVDALRKDLRVAYRTEDGQFHAVEPGVSSEEALARALEVWRTIENEGYGARASRVLRNNGFNSWVNQAGDVAVEPTGTQRYRTHAVSQETH